ncbi:hypothetical protein BS78_06G191900 [Paspalum vaginatum]|nr:hypothetical protein BS78_06G191900 [Paspalum vaginatum]
MAEACRLAAHRGARSLLQLLFKYSLSPVCRSRLARLRHGRRLGSLGGSRGQRNTSIPTEVPVGNHQRLAIRPRPASAMKNSLVLRRFAGGTCLLNTDTLRYAQLPAARNLLLARSGLKSRVQTHR